MHPTQISYLICMYPTQIHIQHGNFGVGCKGPSNMGQEKLKHLVSQQIERGFDFFLFPHSSSVDLIDYPIPFLPGSAIPGFRKKASNMFQKRIISMFCQLVWNMGPTYNTQPWQRQWIGFTCSHGNFKKCSPKFQRLKIPSNLQSPLQMKRDVLAFLRRPRTSKQQIQWCVCCLKDWAKSFKDWVFLDLSKSSNSCRLLFSWTQSCNRNKSKGVLFSFYIYLDLLFFPCMSCFISRTEFSMRRFELKIGWYSCECNSYNFSALMGSPRPLLLCSESFIKADFSFP